MTSPGEMSDRGPCACGHDEPDHRRLDVGCIHCGNCGGYVSRSTYAPQRRSVASSQLECDVAEVLHAHDSVTWADALDLSASLLSGPLAPLLAKMRAVEGLANRPSGYIVYPSELRRALAGES